MAAELASSNRMEPQALRALIGRNKQSDKVFAIIGLLAMLVGVFALLWLLIGLAFYFMYGYRHSRLRKAA